MNIKYKFTTIYTDVERIKMLDFLQFLDHVAVFLTPDFSIVDFNENAKEFYNWEKKDISQQSYLKWCEENQITSLITAKDLTLLQQGKSIRDVRRKLPDKGWISWDIICNLNKNSIVDGIFLIGKKIIPPVAANQLQISPTNHLSICHQPSATKSNILLDDILSGMPCLVFWKDTNFAYLGCNDLTASLLGLSSRKEVIGKTDYDFGWKKEDVDEYRKVDERILKTGKPCYNLEETIVYPGKEPIVFLTNKMPLFDEYNQIIGIVGINIDITDRKKAEAALKEAKQAAEKANKAKSDFIGNMSHDIKTPLAGMVGIAEYLAYTLEKKKNISLAQSIAASGQQLIVFFDNCLEAAKIDNMDIVAVKENFNLKTLIDDITQMFKSAILNKRLAAHLYYDANVPEDFIGARPAIFRILMNLLGNAVKFTEAGSITFNVSLEEAISVINTVKIKISITDTGIGIPKNMCVQIFERFVTVKPSNKGEATKGSGLGLYLVKSLVEAIQGEVFVSSKENHGSQFTVVLPLEIAALTDQARRGGSPSAHYQQIHPTDLMKALTKESPPLTRKTSSQLRLLLVEDNNISQKVAGSMLTVFNCKVDVAESGTQAIELFEAGKYHVIFMDLGLPDFSGYEITHHFRKIEEGSNHRAPIIALSAHVDEDIEKECLEAGMDKILSKPLSLEKAKDIIDYYASLIA